MFARKMPITEELPFNPLLHAQQEADRIMDQLRDGRIDAEEAARQMAEVRKRGNPLANFLLQV